MKIARLARAASVSGDGLAAWACALNAWLSISGTAITEASAVLLPIAIARLVNGGSANRIAWGRTTCRKVSENPRPVERAASH